MNRLLIVDDDPAWRALYRMAFDCQFEMFEAADAQEALARLDEVRPDLILLDLRMPRMGGLDFIRRLDHRDGRVPIVICSGAVAEGECPVVPGVPVTPKTPDLRDVRAALRAVAPIAAASSTARAEVGAVEETYWRD